VSFKYYLVYKPFQVMSQFSPVEGKLTLKDFFEVEINVYPVGRLDYDSEGLLLLTNDKRLNQQLLHPLSKQDKEYYVQVEGLMTPEALRQLEKGVTINIDGKPHKTLPAKARLLNPMSFLPERNPPIRYRAHIPTSWISLTLTEGKNRQVRRMTAAVGFPTLRLVRWRQGRLTIEGLEPGDMRMIGPRQLLP
jgi:23S rRNA pseudouridine2457 synthase